MSDLTPSFERDTGHVMLEGLSADTAGNHGVRPRA